MGKLLRCAVLALAATLAFGGMWLAAAPAAAGEDQPAVNPLSRFVPADALLFIAYDGNNAAFSKTALNDILNEPEVKATFEGPLAALRKLLAEGAQKEGAPGPDAIEPLLRTKIGLALSGIAPPPAEGVPPQPEVLLLVEVGADDSPAAKAVPLLIDRALTKAGLPPDVFRRAKIAGTDARAADLGLVTVSYATVRGTFVLGTGGALAKALDANTTKLGASKVGGAKEGLSKLGASKEFQRVSSLTGGNEILLVHYAHGAVVQQFGMFLPRPVSRILVNPDLGLAGVRSLSFALTPDGKGLRTSFFIRAPGEKKGILSFIAGRPLAPAVIKLAPANTDFFAAQSLDAAALWDFIVNGVLHPTDRRSFLDAMTDAKQQVGFDLRDDLLASVGDEFAAFGPGHFAIKLRNPARFRQCVTTALEKLTAAIAEEPDFRDSRLVLRTMDYKGRTIEYADSTCRFPLVIQPCYTMVGDYAVFAFSPASLKSYITSMAAGKTLADNADFVAVRAKLGPDASAVCYADSSSFLSDLYGVLPWAFGFAKMAPDEAQALVPDPARLPAQEDIAKHLFGSVAVVRSLDDGVLWECHSPVGLPTPPALRQGGGVATMAILGGMLLPALGRARDEARKVKSASNLRGIAQFSHLWRVKKGEDKFYPPSLKALLDDGMIDNARAFLNPASNTQLAEGKFVSDYESIFDRAGFKVADEAVPVTLPLAWDRENVHGDGRNVVFFDSHVEFVNEKSFQKLLKTVDDWI